MMPPPPTKFETDRAGQLVYPNDNGEPLSNDTEHLRWITFVKNGLDDWFADRDDVFVAADLLWYPVEGRPDISKAPDVMVALSRPAGDRLSYKQWEENGRPPNVVFEFISKSHTADEMIEELMPRPSARSDWRPSSGSWGSIPIVSNSLSPARGLASGSGLHRGQRPQPRVSV